MVLPSNPIVVLALFICLNLWAETGEVPGLKTIRGEKEILQEKKSSPVVNDSEVQAVGKEIRQFGEEVAKGVDRVIKKKTFELGGDPWTFQGIPLILPSASSGFNLGVLIQLQDIQRQDPHKIEVALNVLNSDRGRYKHALKIDVPHLFDDQYRVTARAAYDRDITFRYFGIGNSISVDRNAIDKDLEIYRNVRAGPSFSLEVFRYFEHHIRFGPVFGLKWTKIESPGSLLIRENPVGITGGRTHFIGAAVIHDTLDFEPYPSRGGSQELYVQYYSPLLGDDYHFLRNTWTYRRYTLLHRNLIFAHRTLLESFFGDVPYYELGGVGGSNSTIGLGGDRFFRGYDSNRFIDKLRLIFGFELRWDPLLFEFYRQTITVGFVPWVDVGRVWSQLFPIDLSRIHASAGWGMRLAWNSRFIIRTDFAVTREGTAFILELGNSF